MPALADPRALAEYPLFRDLPDDELAELNGLLRRKSYDAGSNIITVEDPGELVFVLLQGTVKIFVHQIDGREVILAFLGPGDTVGEMSLVDSAGRSANVLTLEETTCLAMGRDAFNRCLLSMHQLSYNLARLLSRRLRLANEQIQALSSLDLRGRVARQIVAFAEQYGEELPSGAVRIPLRLTQTDLASIVGASRERVNQVVVELKNEGYISVARGHKIHLHQRDELVRYYG